MLKHYIKIAFRNLAQQKVLTAINIMGLSIGIACFSLFLLYAVHEFSYDRFHTNADNIYRIVEWWQGEGREPGGSASISTPVAPAMKKDFPDVEYAVRTTDRGCLARVSDHVFHTSITFADPDFFKIFSFPLIHGNAKTALNDPSHIIVTKEKALMLFGTTDVVGKTIQLKIDSAYEPFTISGVAENIPANSSKSFQVLGNFEHIANTPMVKESSNNWFMTIGIDAFVKLKQGSTLAGDVNRLASFRQKYFIVKEKKDKKGKRQKKTNRTRYRQAFACNALRAYTHGPAG